jgi:hypothetical protein
VRNGTPLITKAERILRQNDARWLGNPVSLPRIVDVLGPNLLRGRIAANKPSAADIFG